MKKFKYEIDLEKLHLNDTEKEEFKKTDPNQKTLFEMIFNQGLQSKYQGQGGIGGPKQRSLGRILNKLDEASVNYITLEESEYDLLKEIFCEDSAKFDPRHTRAVVQYIEEVEKACKV